MKRAAREGRPLVSVGSIVLVVGGDADEEIPAQSVIEAGIGVAVARTVNAGSIGVAVGRVLVEQVVDAGAKDVTLPELPLHGEVEIANIAGFSIDEG